MNDRLKPFQLKLLHHDAAIVSSPSTEGNNLPIFPMIGNGHFGCSWRGKQHLMLRNKRSLNWVLEGVYPLLQLEMPAQYSTENMLVDFHDGVMYKFQCFKLNYLCLSSKLSVYAHRTRPHLLIQDLKLFNPTSRDASVKLQRMGQSLSEVGYRESELKLTFKASHTGETTSIVYICSVRRSPVPRDHLQRQAWIILLTPKFPTLIPIPRDRTQSHHFITAISVSNPFSSEMPIIQAELILNTTLQLLKEELLDALVVHPDDLLKEHISVWNNVWKSGLYISPSLAPGVINGLDVNSTIYLVLSHTPAPLHLHHLNLTQFKDYSNALLQPDRCYNGHDTFHVNELWRRVNDEQDAQHLVNVWLLTLEKQGCANILKAGVEGVMQALILSLGSFEFSGEHLEFRMNPTDLHRDFHFRGLLLFDLENSVDVRVILDEEYRPGLRVIAHDNRPSKPLYACGAVCEGGPVLITSRGTSFPVKLTKPRTALLYMSDSQEHLQELGHAVHVSEVQDAPAHDHQVIALHRHGHTWGGIPLIFWVAIVLLVAIFHIFLFRLIYQEYCVKGEGAVSNLPPASFRYQRHSNMAWQQHAFSHNNSNNVLPNWQQHHGQHTVF